MPCNSEQSDSCRERIVYMQNYDDKIKLNKALDELDTVTRYLCYIIGEYKHKKMFDELPKAIKKWSESHDQFDEKRIDSKIIKLIKLKITNR